MEDAALLLFLVVGVVTCALMTLHEPVPGTGLSQTHWDGGHNLELTAVY